MSKTLPASLPTITTQHPLNSINYKIPTNVLKLKGSIESVILKVNNMTIYLKQIPQQAKISNNIAPNKHYNNKLKQ
jgi:hypothetical protein